MQQNIPERLVDFFPFRNLSEEDINAVLAVCNYSVRSFRKGETIFSPTEYEKKIGFILNGECAVHRVRSEGSAVYLNSLKKNDSFGILAVLTNEEEYPTLITAVKTAEVLFIGDNDMINVIKQFPAVAMNLISFLAGRIVFLNKKIVTFSEKTTLEKLASYLLDKYKKQGAIINASRTKISEEINVGRASLYRDLDILVSEGIIKLEQKRIIINCPEGLERKKI